MHNHICITHALSEQNNFLWGGGGGGGGHEHKHMPIAIGILIISRDTFVLVCPVWGGGAHTPVPPPPPPVTYACYQAFLFYFFPCYIIMYVCGRQAEISLLLPSLLITPALITHYSRPHYSLLPPSLLITPALITHYSRPHYSLLPPSLLITPALITHYSRPHYSLLPPSLLITPALITRSGKVRPETCTLIVHTHKCTVKHQEYVCHIVWLSELRKFG